MGAVSGCCCSAAPGSAAVEDYCRHRAEVPSPATRLLPPIITSCCHPPNRPPALPSIPVLQAAERDYDLNRAAELKYGTLLELQKQLKEAELLLDQADSQVGEEWGCSGCLVIFFPRVGRDSAVALQAHAHSACSCLLLHAVVHLWKLESQRRSFWYLHCRRGACCTAR
jgi:hypothetical protein